MTNNANAYLFKLTYHPVCFTGAETFNWTAITTITHSPTQNTITTI